MLEITLQSSQIRTDQNRATTYSLKIKKININEKQYSICIHE